MVVNLFLLNFENYELVWLNFKFLLNRLVWFFFFREVNIGVVVNKRELLIVVELDGFWFFDFVLFLDFYKL